MFPIFLQLSLGYSTYNALRILTFTKIPNQSERGRPSFQHYLGKCEILKQLEYNRTSRIKRKILFFLCISLSLVLTALIVIAASYYNVDLLLRLLCRIDRIYRRNWMWKITSPVLRIFWLFMGKIQVFHFKPNFRTGEQWILSPFLLLPKGNREFSDLFSLLTIIF